MVMFKIVKIKNHNFFLKGLCCSHILLNSDTNIFGMEDSGKGNNFKINSVINFGNILNLHNNQNDSINNNNVNDIEFDKLSTIKPIEDNYFECESLQFLQKKRNKGTGKKFFEKNLDLLIRRCLEKIVTFTNYNFNKLKEIIKKEKIDIDIDIDIDNLVFQDINVEVNISEFLLDTKILNFLFLNENNKNICGNINSIFTKLEINEICLKIDDIIINENINNFKIGENSENNENSDVDEILKALSQDKDFYINEENEAKEVFLSFRNFLDKSIIDFFLHKYIHGDDFCSYVYDEGIDDDLKSKIFDYKNLFTKDKIKDYLEKINKKGIKNKINNCKKVKISDDKYVENKINFKEYNFNNNLDFGELKNKESEKVIKKVKKSENNKNINKKKLKSLKLKNIKKCKKDEKFNWDLFNEIKNNNNERISDSLNVNYSNSRDSKMSLFSDDVNNINDNNIDLEE